MGATAFRNYLQLKILIEKVINNPGLFRLVLLLSIKNGKEKDRSNSFINKTGQIQNTIQTRSNDQCRLANAKTSWGRTFLCSLLICLLVKMTDKWHKYQIGSKLLYLSIIFFGNFYLVNFVLMIALLFFLFEF